MNTKARMTISDFSYFTGITKDTLRFYDKIGLLSPELRGDNNYRYYTERQLDMGFLIGDLRALGIELAKIKQYADQRSPERMLALFAEQDTRIEQEIQRLRSIQEVMHLRTDMAAQALQYSDGTVVLEEKKREPIFLCPVLNSRETDIEQLTFSYNFAISQGVNISFPFGSIIRKNVFMESGEDTPLRHYFKVSKKHNAWKSEGTYAVLYRNSTDEPTADLYKPLLTYVKQNGLKVISDAYEEYPLDELSVRSWDAFKIRVEIQVTKQ